MGTRFGFGWGNIPHSNASGGEGAGRRELFDSLTSFTNLDSFASLDSLTSNGRVTAIGGYVIDTNGLSKDGPWVFRRRQEKKLKKTYAYCGGEPRCAKFHLLLL